MITIICSGSRGDFQPYVALARELQKQGKEVRITAGASQEEFVRTYYLSSRMRGGIFCGRENGNTIRFGISVPYTQK